MARITNAEQVVRALCTHYQVPTPTVIMCHLGGGIEGEFGTPYKGRPYIWVSPIARRGEGVEWVACHEFEHYMGWLAGDAPYPHNGNSEREQRFERQVAVHFNIWQATK